MSWLINTAWASLKPAFLALLLIACAAFAQEMQPPAQVTAGSSFSIPTSGSGSAELYLIGPADVKKQKIHLGSAVEIGGTDTRAAGKYLAIVCADTCRTSTFFVVPAEPGSLSFLVHPSRVPVQQKDAISGVALAFDNFRNLVLKPLSISFKLSTGGSTVMSNLVPTTHGAAWFRTSPGSHAGAGEASAALGDIVAQRVVRLVASDPCNLRIKAQRSKAGIVVETEPVRDCSGNPVPDGTIVTFTASGPSGKSTVDAPVKAGIARAELLTPNQVVISVASGVVLGNEVQVGGQL
jgi:hypothetical protein